MVTVKGRKTSNKNPPILSHEFIIQNHADIVSCVAMVFVVGLMVQVTSPWAYNFIAIHHNATTAVPESPDGPILPLKYTTGWKDVCAVFFYFLITIVMHAVIQEYIFDKISKRFHLSKSKHSKFNESCQLITFYVLSAAWGIDIIMRDNLLLNISSLWESYPGVMSFSLKLFFIGQLAYWLHSYPELYFQRAKKEEILPRIVLATFGLFFSAAAYVLNFQHVGVILFVLHYVGEALQHGARLIHFVSHNEKTTQLAFLVANAAFIFARLATVALSGLVFFYGLGQIERSLDFATGKFNIQAVQYGALGAILLFQAYLFYSFIKRQMKFTRENKTPVVSKAKSKQKPRKKDAKDGKKSEDDDLPEVDQATKKNLRTRYSAKAK
ncbi:translocating chain-associated membrane protein 1 [Leptopilina heterotoma]|uniref:translocating chain-associated membrane protein 1 n=1 Tax=Leptopilina heterotoma TaxID=63436 RepID=UPI001CA87CAF|nr:translocating chain-associated membrane protein 1 [Leptopilina heterotoma]